MASLQKRSYAIGAVYYEQYSRKLVGEFGARLVSDIGIVEISQLQTKRLNAGLSARSVNCEIATLRQILKQYGCWNAIAGRVRFLRERTDSGRALSLEEEDKLLQAISRSASAALYPFFLLSLDAGLRPSESRALRRKDLMLRWENGAIAEGRNHCVAFEDGKRDRTGRSSHEPGAPGVIGKAHAMS
jgi:integrase